MTRIKLNLPTVLALLVVVAAGAFAAGQSTQTSASSSSFSMAAPPPTAAAPAESDDPPPNETLPPGHPPIGSLNQGGAEPASVAAPGSNDAAPLEWKAPPRWQRVRNASTMRLATYRVPRAPGDSEDAEMAVVQAGGTVEANADRWVGQFDPSERTASRSTRQVGPLSVTVVDVQGTYSGGMGPQAAAHPRWALLGAIVPLAESPCFFKLTGPAKSVAAARGEFEAMVGSLTRPPP